MNKSLLITSIAFAAVIILAPFNTHAAFTFTASSANGDGQAYVAPNGTTASFSAPNPYNGVSYSLDPLTACQDAASASGLSDTVDTYCVYDADEEGTLAGSSFYGSGGGATGCNGTCSGNPPARGYGTWPPGSDEWLHGYFPESYVTLYQTPLTKMSLSTVLNALDTYNGGIFAHTFAQSCVSYAQQNGLDASGCPADPGLPQDPGYRDVCELSHRDQKGNSLAPNNINPTGPAAACSVYHHTGVVNQKPVANLTANPASVVSGNSSLLTYSCSNGATSASIDNGVGTLSPVAAGSKPVTPGATATYTLTCTNAAGSSTASTTVTVESPLSAACTVSPSSTTVGMNVNWSATASGGNGTFSYSWGGTDGLSGSSSSVSKSYSTTGTKTGSVTVSSGTQSITSDCSNTVNVSAAPVAALSCSVSSTNPPLNTSVTYTASGASTPYTWAASDGGSYGTGATASRSFSTAGDYAMTVSKAGYTSATCPVVAAGNGTQSCTNPTLVLTGSSTRIKPGNTTTITYSATGVSSCTLTGPGAPAATTPNSCSLPQGSFTTPALSTQTAYTLTCDGISKTLIINVPPNIIEF